VQRLKLIVQNRRFLVLAPQGQHPNLASQTLGAALRALPEQWGEHCGYRPLLAESFTDPEAYAGTCYKASNWEAVGGSAGYARHRADFYVPNQRPKRLWLRELVPNARRQLRAPQVPADSDPAQGGRIVREAAGSRQPHDVIAPQAGAAIDRTGLQAVKLDAGLGPRHAERGGPSESVKPLEVHVAAVHDVNGAGLQREFVEEADIGLFALGNRDDGGDGTPDVEQGVEFDGRLGRAEARPGKEAQAQVDGGGVERIDGVVEFLSQGFAGIESTGAPDQSLGQVGVDAPVTGGIGVSQGAVRDGRLKPQVIELLAARTETDLQVGETLPEGHLGERHGEELIPAAEPSDLVMPAVTNDAAAELLGVNPLHELSENGFARVHARNLARRISKKTR
jgi:hypothetical protein